MVVVKEGGTGLDQSTKQRVVGIAVIVIAAVVLLPVLFDGQGSYELPIESRIPEPTPFPTPPRIIPERPVIVADSEPASVVTQAVEEPAAQDSAEPVPDPVNPDSVVSNQNTDPAEPPAAADDDNAPMSIDDIIASLGLDSAQSETASSDSAPRLDADGLPEGWSVRLASFSSESNARNLVERLSNAGHRAYTRVLESSQGPLVAVFVGPGVDRAAVQQLQQQLQQQFQLAGIVVRYEIEEL